MSELKTLLAEARSNLQDLESLLQRARSFDQPLPGERFVSREEIQMYFEEILKALERMPANLRLEPSPQRKDEIRWLHLEMENVRHRVEKSIGLLEAACERNIEQLAESVSSQQQFTSTAKKNLFPEPVSPLNELLRQGKASLASKDYEACVKLMGEALHEAPGNSQAASYLQEARRKWEDQCLEEELVIHIEDLKRDAMNLFDRERYADCVGIFKFLCELEPKNQTLRNYLELSQERLLEIQAPFGLEQRGMPACPTAELDPEEQVVTTPTPSAAFTANVREEPSNNDGNHAIGVEEASGSASADHVDSLPNSTDLFRPEDGLADVPAKFDEGASASPEVGSRKPPLVLAAGMAVVLGILAVALLLLRSPKAELVGSLLIRSDPGGANVFVDDTLRGQTELLVESLPEGRHRLQLEKEGYGPVSQAFMVEPEKVASLSIQLQKFETEAVSMAQLGQQASELFDRGLWLDASQRCDQILERDPKNPTASALKNRIRKHFWQEAQAARRRNKLDDARVALENLLKSSPQDAAALRELKTLKAKSLKEASPAPSEEAQFNSRIEELHQRIAAAMSSGRYFPPAQGNALELVQRLGGLSPTDPVFKDKLEQLHREAISQLQRKIQSQDREVAKIGARELLSYFPASAELRHLHDSLNAGELQRVEVRNTLTQKLDSAMARGNYVTPANDNVLAYCNRLLALEGQNPRTHSLRLEALTRATAQAKDFTLNEKFEDARDVLSALLAVAQTEGRPAAVLELKSQLDKLEFAVYPVIHDHTLGNCSGRLRMNAYVLAYIPSGDTKDGFSQKLSEIAETEGGDKLKVQLNNKTYRFQANLAKNKEENRYKVEEMYQKLRGLMKR
jgi:tetratricopeptide (TPR) repeat protein